MAVCPSCPQACIAPGFREAKSKSFSSWMGSASMSARMAGEFEIAERLEGLVDEPGCFLLVVGDLGVAMQVPPPGDYLWPDLPNEVVEGYGSDGSPS
jgi:hypothetical protein